MDNGVVDGLDIVCCRCIPTFLLNATFLLLLKSRVVGANALIGMSGVDSSTVVTIEIGTDLIVRQYDVM